MKTSGSSRRRPGPPAALPRYSLPRWSDRRTAVGDTARLLEALARAEAYPHEVRPVEVIQTHLSTVFLAGPYAYKVKKPVDFGFVDFSTLERRRHFCHEEVRLNRRLAPGVYHGVVPIVAAPEGLRVLDAPLENPSATPPIPGGGEVVEWAVRMLRLPPERTLKSLLRRGELDGPRGAALLERLARLLADFHRTARRGAEISRVADFEGVGATARENLDQLRDAVGATLRPEVLERLREGSERTLGALRTQIEERARENRPCDTHGDLRLGHVYLLGDGESGGRIVIVDCIEFAARFRYADPVSDIAFLTMELEFEDRPDLARAFTDHYLRDAADPEGAALLPYWIAYRDIVRGKVRTLAARDPSISRPERVKSASRATRHFLRALVRLAPEDERPVLVLLGGLPGVGKSQLARSLSEASDFTWIDTDRVRRELTGSLPAPEAPTAFEAGAYAPAWTERTYEACLRRASALLFLGSRVVVEASFRRERHRNAFLALARAMGVPAVLLLCRADPAVVRSRLAGRATGGHPAGERSEADWRIHQAMARRWEEMDPRTASRCRTLGGDGAAGEVLDRALTIIRDVTS